MPKIEEPHIKYVPEPNDKRLLTVECGHHCGVITVGGSHRHIGHCPCVECHDGDEEYR